MIFPDIGIVSDEISTDFREAVRLGGMWDVTRFEIRCLRSGRVPEVDTEEWKEVRDIVERERLRVSAVSPGLFKVPISDSAVIERQLREVLPRAIDDAQGIGAGAVVVFGFVRGENPGGTREAALDYLRRAAELGRANGITIAVENEPGFWCDTGSHTAEMIEAVGSPFLRANWDPANAFGCGETPWPEGYERIKQHIAGVHAKDTSRGALVECVPIGMGSVDWQGQLAALARDGFLDRLTIETHCLPLAERSEENLRTLRRMIARMKGTT